MKKLSILLTFLMLCGCNTLPQSSSQSVSKKPDTANGCPENPQESLDSKNVKSIPLSTQNLKESGQASAGKYLGYSFEAQSGQKLNYRTSDTICIWIYAPDNQLISTKELPQTGKYLIEISAPKGSTTFTLEMSLGTLEASTPPASSSPSTGTSPTSSSSITPPTSAQVADITQAQALEIVQGWYKSKPRIFSAPFDTSLVDQYTTGKLHYDTTKSDGSVAWLRNHNSYYTYNRSSIEDIVSFSNSGMRPSITVRVSENLQLRGSEGWPNPKEYTANAIYYFEKENGVWKIYDYDVVKK